MKPQARHKAYQKRARTVLRLPDLEFAKAAVLDSLTSTDAQLRMRSYGCAATDAQLRMRSLGRTTERHLGSKQRIRSAVNDRIGIEPVP
jgi:hypothetical protein